MNGYTIGIDTAKTGDDFIVIAVWDRHMKEFASIKRLPPPPKGRSATIGGLVIFPEAIAAREWMATKGAEEAWRKSEVVKDKALAAELLATKACACLNPDCSKRVPFRCLGAPGATKAGA